MFASRFKLLFAFWAIGEALAFVAVVHAIGFGGALLAGLITTLAGAGLLRRVGTAAVLRLRAGLGRRSDPSADELLNGGLRALAAVALLLPGFLSDAVGIALALPPVRGALARRIGGSGLRRREDEPGSRHGPGAIDLAPEEWTSSPVGSGNAVSKP